MKTWAAHWFPLISRSLPLSLSLLLLLSSSPQREKGTNVHIVPVSLSLFLFCLSWFCTLAIHLQYKIPPSSTSYRHHHHHNHHHYHKHFKICQQFWLKISLSCCFYSVRWHALLYMIACFAKYTFSRFISFLPCRSPYLSLYFFAFHYV